MSFEETENGGKQCRFVRPAAKLVCPDSGQVKEPLCPTNVRKRGRERGKRKRMRVIWCLRRHGLEPYGVSEGTHERVHCQRERSWRRS